MIIEIDGVGQVQVDDKFETLSNEQQQKILQKIKKDASVGITKGVDASKPVEDQKLRSIAQGLTLGFSDEIEAAGKTAVSKIGQLFGGEGKSYDESLDEVRDKLEAYRGAKPMEALGYELGGAVVPALGAGLFTFGTGGAAVGTATAARVAPTLARAAKIGAIEGGIAGFGTGEGGFKDRAKSAAVGTALGGTFGAAIPVAGQQVKRGLQTVYKGAMPSSLGGANLVDAERRIANALERDQISPDQAKKLLQDAKDLGVDDMTIADLGKNTQKQAWLAGTTPNDKRSGVYDQLDERRLNQAENISEKTSEKLSVDGPIGIEYIDDLARRTSEEAAPLYKQAYSIDLDAKPFAAFSKNSAIQNAYKEAVALAEIDPDVADFANMPKNLDKFFGDTIGRGESVSMPTQVAHQIKIGLDSLIEKQTDSVTGKVTQKGRVLIKLKDRWNKEIVRQNKPYKIANSKYSDKMNLKSAFDDGTNIAKYKSDLLVKKVSAMSPPEKEAFRTGLVSQIQELAMKTGDVSDFTKTIFGSPKKRAAIRLAFGNKKDFENFERFIKLEQDKVKTYNQMYGGSQTTDKAIEAGFDDFDAREGITLLQQMFTNPVTAVGTATRNMSRKGLGLNAETSGEVLNILSETDPARQRLMLDALNQRKNLDAISRQRLLNRPEIYSGLLGSQSSSLFAKED